MDQKKKLNKPASCISVGCNRPAVVRGYCRTCDRCARDRTRRGYVYYGFRGK